MTGQKWFTSAPMNDLFLTLAQAPGRADLRRRAPGAARRQPQRDAGCSGSRTSWATGRTPRPRSSTPAPSGGGSATRAAASRPCSTMVTMTRLDCVLGSAGLIRIALTRGGAPRRAPQRVRCAAGRRAADADGGGRPGVGVGGGDGAGAAAGRAPSTASERDLLRLALPAAKYLVCKRAPTVVAEALECLGGDGYVEDSGHAAALPRGAAELDLGGLGQRHGAGRAARGDAGSPSSAEAVLAEIDAAAGADTWFDRGVRELRTELRGREERRARRLAEMLALCLQGSLLLRFAPDDVASAFVSSRFLPDGPWRTAGTLPAEAHTSAAALPSRERVRHPVARSPTRGRRRRGTAGTQGPEVHQSPSSARVSSPKGLTPGPAARAWATCTCRHFTRSACRPR